jgi:hypothetical protein
MKVSLTIGHQTACWLHWNWLVEQQFVDICGVVTLWSFP